MLPLPPEMAERAIIELGGERHLVVRGPRPEAGARRGRTTADGEAEVKLPVYTVGAKVATRKAYGDALAALGARRDVVAMDGEVSNSTYADEFAQKYPERFFEMYIAEQQLIAAAVGFSVRGYRPFASTFAAFFSRAYDFIRMASISRASISLSGSHAGVEIGADGPSQMALEDLAIMRAVHGSTVLYPSDATSAAALVGSMADLEGVSYIRTTRGAYPVLYPDGEPFPVGGAKVVRSSDADQVTLVGAGVTLHECLAASDQLAADGIRARVIDLYSVKPVDTAALTAAAAATGGRFVLVEDHHPEGGLGSAVLGALTEAGRADLSVEHLAVRNMPGSGTSAELMDAAGISAAHIADAARRLSAGRADRVPGRLARVVARELRVPQFGVHLPRWLGERVPGLQQRLEVRADSRPADRDGLVRVLVGEVLVADGEPDDIAVRSEVERDDGRTVVGPRRRLVSGHCGWCVERQHEALAGDGFDHRADHIRDAGSVGAHVFPG